MRSNCAHCEFTALGAGRYALAGVLGFQTVADLLEHSKQWLADPAPRLELDLSAVEQSDSAGLALLLEWLSRAAQARKELCYRNIPAELQAIAHITEVDKLIGAAVQCR